MAQSQFPTIDTTTKATNGGISQMGQGLNPSPSAPEIRSGIQNQLPEGKAYYNNGGYGGYGQKPYKLPRKRRAGNYGQAPMGGVPNQYGYGFGGYPFQGGNMGGGFAGFGGFNNMMGQPLPLGGLPLGGGLPMGG